MSRVGILRDYLAQLRSLDAYFARPLDLAEARALVRTRVQRRDELFLAMAHSAFVRPGSPYRALLDAAGCTLRDLEIMVRQRGVEGTLRALYQAGVYLSFEEYNSGEVRRGGREIRFTAADLAGPGGPGAMALRTGGTRSGGRWVNLHIDNLAEQSAPQYGIALDMLAGPRAPVFLWQLGFPSGAAIATWFALGRLRRPPTRWFSLNPVPPRLFGRRGHHRLLLYAARRAARRGGVHLPLPEFAPVTDAAKVLEAVMATLQTEGRGVVITTPSCAVRLAVEARRRGGSLRGLGILTGAEPLTNAKAEEIVRAGARVRCHYASMEAGLMGAPCGNPRDVDDMHFRSDALAMITVPRDLAGVTVETLMLTSLLPTAPRIFWNVEIDDFAQVEERRCGCVWDELGCGPHLLGVRSFTKLTGEGTTVVGSNVVHIVEQVLPQAFGGASTDYQLVEAEDEERLTRLFLLISPSVGPLDEAVVIGRFTEALRATAGTGLGAGGGMRQVWEQADSIRILRREPISTSLGKLLPFHTLGAAQLDQRGVRKGSDRPTTTGRSSS